MAARQSNIETYEKTCEMYDGGFMASSHANILSWLQLQAAETEYSRKNSSNYRRYSKIA